MAQGLHAVVVGGGFFGCAIALYLKRTLGRVRVIEQEDELFAHASYCNQARIHNGYHYPRSLQTGYRSRINTPFFVKDFPDCVVNNFTKLYCVAGPLSKVTPRQFERFCDLIGAPWKPARAAHATLFNWRLVAAVYEVQELAFDSHILRDQMKAQMDADGVEVQLSTRVLHVDTTPGDIVVSLSDGTELRPQYLFNCTYAGLKHIAGLSAECQTGLKLEIAEMALINIPEELNGIAVTVMCGPFFSVMPFPTRGLHTLSHVRYTPHTSWNDSDEVSPYTRLREYEFKSRAEAMLLDSSRYLPLLRKSEIRGSLLDVKAVLERNEMDDGRPILFEKSVRNPKIYSVLGGKLDNVYDVYQRLSLEGF
jgi:hypothetical protein